MSGVLIEMVRRYRDGRKEPVREFLVAETSPELVKAWDDARAGVDREYEDGILVWQAENSRQFAPDEVKAAVRDAFRALGGRVFDEVTIPTAFRERTDLRMQIVYSSHSKVYMGGGAVTENLTLTLKAESRSGRPVWREPPVLKIDLGEAPATIDITLQGGVVVSNPEEERRMETAAKKIAEWIPTLPKLGE